MSFCAKCRDEWKQERLEIARAEATQQANDRQQTQAIIKEGCIFKIINLADIGQSTVIEYISAGCN